MDACPIRQRWPGPHPSLDFWASVVSSSVFEEGPDQLPLSPEISSQTQSVLSCLVLPVDWVEICRWEQREEWMEWTRRTWSMSVEFSSTVGLQGVASVMIVLLYRYLGTAPPTPVKGTWPGSTRHLSCRGPKSTRPATGDLGSRLRFACYLPEVSSVRWSVVLPGLSVADRYIT